MTSKESFIRLYSFEEEKNCLNREEFSTVLTATVEKFLEKLSILQSNAFLVSCDENTLNKLYSQISERAYYGSANEKREYLSARRILRPTPLEKDKQLLLYIAGAEGVITEDGKVYIFSPFNISKNEAADRIAELIPVGSGVEIITEGECWGFLDVKNLSFDELDLLWEEINGFD